MQIAVECWQPHQCLRSQEWPLFCAEELLLFGRTLPAVLDTSSHLLCHTCPKNQRSSPSPEAAQGRSDAYTLGIVPWMYQTRSVKGLRRDQRIGSRHHILRILVCWCGLCSQYCIINPQTVDNLAVGIVISARLQGQTADTPHLGVRRACDLAVTDCLTGVPTVKADAFAETAMAKIRCYYGRLGLREYQKRFTVDTICTHNRLRFDPFAWRLFLTCIRAPCEWPFWAAKTHLVDMLASGHTRYQPQFWSCFARCICRSVRPQHRIDLRS